MTQKPTLANLADMRDIKVKIGSGNPDVNDNVNVNNDISINQLLNLGHVEKELVGVYFEQEIADVLRKLANKRGQQSLIVNEAVKRMFKANGYL